MGEGGFFVLDTAQLSERAWMDGWMGLGGKGKGTRFLLLWKARDGGTSSVGQPRWRRRADWIQRGRPWYSQGSGQAKDHRLKKKTPHFGSKMKRFIGDYEIASGRSSRVYSWSSS